MKPEENQQSESRQDATRAPECPAERAISSHSELRDPHSAILDLRRAIAAIPEDALMELAIAPCATPEAFDARTAARIILFAKRELSQRCLPTFRIS